MFIVGRIRIKGRIEKSPGMFWDNFVGMGFVF